MKEQKLLHNFLTSDIINVLINLFDMNTNDNIINNNPFSKSSKRHTRKIHK
jgi:hypothetical protein